jgi:acetyl esterase/lipase
MLFNRRALIGLTALLAMARRARADMAPPPAAVDPAEPADVIPLWHKHPPGGAHPKLTQTVIERDNPYGLRDRAVTGIVQPALSVFPARYPSGAAVLIVPGGSYQRVVVDKEGFETARLLVGRGITAFVLLYRWPGEGWAAGPDTPLQDAQRALRLARGRAAHYRFNPARLGVLGFSAGGHVAASLATRFDAKVYARIDEADDGSARPDFSGLLYPVITMGEGAHAGSRDNLLGKSPSAAAIAAYSAQSGISSRTPPTFLVHAADDTTVPVENSLKMFSALKASNIAAEMHIFEQGGHGFGLRGITGKPVAAWPELFLSWAKSHKFV